MSGNVVAFEAADIGAAADDAVVAARGTLEHLTDGGSHGAGIVGRDVESVGATGFLKAGACAGDDGESAADGLDDGDAEAFIARGVDESLSTCVEGGELGIADAMEDMDAAVEAVGTDIALHVVGLGCVAAYNDEVEVGGQDFGLFEGLDGQEDVLTGLDGADVQDVAIRV